MTITEDRQKTIRDMTVLQIWQAVEPLLAVAMKAYQFGPSSYTYEALQACMDIRDIMHAAIVGEPESFHEEEDQRPYDY